MPESLSHITTESQWRGLMLTSRREILACVHVEENGRWEEYGALSGSLSEEAADSSFPAGALQRRG